MLKHLFVTGLTYILVFAALPSCNTRRENNGKTQLQKDSARLHAYIDSVYDLQFQFPDSAFKLWQPAAAEAREKKIYLPLFNYYKYAVYNRLVMANDSAKAYQLTKEAQQLSRQTGDSLHVGLAAFNMAMLYAYKEITDSASYYFEITAEQLQSGRDKGTLLDTYNNLAEMVRIQGDYVNAEKYLLFLLKATKNRKEWRQLAEAYINLYEVEEELGRPALAKTYLDSAIMNFKKINEPVNPMLLNIRGEYEINHGTTGAAIHYFISAFRGFRQAGDSIHAGIVLVNKARAFYNEKKQDSVTYTLKEIDTYVPPAALPRTALKDYYELQLSLPEKNFLPGVRQKITADYLVLVNNMLAANKKLIGTEYMHKQEQEIKNKLILQTTLKSINRGKTITLLLISAAFLLIMLLLTWFYWRKKQQLEQEKTNLLRHEKNLEVLQMRMNTQLEERSRISQELHDELGATLTSISLAAELLKKKHLLEDSKEANLISHLSSDMVDKMNEIVWSLNTGNDNLQSLVAYIRKFAGSFLEESNISLRFVETEPLPEMGMQGFVRRSLYLTVKEALNNIVKHAGATEVILQVSFQDEALQIMIKDNGVGIEKDKENRWGNGMKNMKAHLKAIGGMINWTTHQGTQINILSPLY